MSVDDKVSADKDIVAEEGRYHLQARYIRKVKGVCPGQRYNHEGVAYCSRCIPCEQYGSDEMVYDKMLGVCNRPFYKCRFLEQLRGNFPGAEQIKKPGEKK